MSDRMLSAMSALCVLATGLIGYLSYYPVPRSLLPKYLELVFKRIVYGVSYGWLLKSPPHPSTTPQKRVLRLPDLLGFWRQPITSNPHIQHIVDWNTLLINSIPDLTKRQTKIAHALGAGSGVAWAYPEAKPVELNIACSLLNAFTLCDDEGEMIDVEAIRKLSKSVFTVIRGSHSGTSESPIVEMHRNFSTLVSSHPSASPEWQNRFQSHYQDWLDAICVEAENRCTGQILTIEKHLQLRRKTMGIMSFVDLALLFTSGAPCSPQFSDDIAKIEELAVELTILQNDIYSFNVEQARGDHANNLVYYVMKENGCTVQQAFDHLGYLFGILAQEMRRLISSLEHSQDTCAPYARNIGTLVFGVMAWSFECRRYFGNDGPRVKKELTIELLPGGAA